MQPVRKQIQEVHADIMKEPITKTLIVDGGSVLYSSFADDKVNENRKK